MSYAKQTWTNDDPDTPVSAARLTHIEDGIANIELTPGPKGSKGEPGKDGFGTSAQYDDIIARLEALETPA